MSSTVLGTDEIAVDSICDSFTVHVLYETFDVQTEFFCVTDEALSLERVLVREDKV